MKGRAEPYVCFGSRHFEMIFLLFYKVLIFKTCSEKEFDSFFIPDPWENFKWVRNTNVKIKSLNTKTKYELIHLQPGKTFITVMLKKNKTEVIWAKINTFNYQKNYKSLSWQRLS